MSEFHPMSYEERRAYIEQAKLDAYRVRVELVAAPFRALYGLVRHGLHHAA